MTVVSACVLRERSSWPPSLRTEIQKKRNVQVFVLMDYRLSLCQSIT
jgi:hypothetical protein